MNKSLRIPILLGLMLAAGEPAPAASAFVHPGGLHTKADLDRMRSKVAAGEHPWIDDWNLLVRDPKAQSDYKAAPNVHMGSRQRAQNDANAAYLNALRWQISGDKAHADCAARIFDAWARTVKEKPAGPDQPGLSGIPIGTFAIAAELLRDYPGWPAANQARFKRMLVDDFYPVCHDFLTRHNGAKPDYFWANWDTCNMRAVLAIGVYCDDRAKFDEAVAYFHNGAGMGSLAHAVPFIYPGGLGQWQESGRDQAHVMGGQGLLAEMCQIAWNQGVDLFGADNNRLLAGAEYSAQYNLWKGVPYTFYTNSADANQYYVSQNYHGRLAASHFELLYNHYVVRKGLAAPFVQHFAELRRPEPGEIDVLGYGTLTYTLDAKASPLPSAPPPVPREVTASAGLGRVNLRWPPSGAYTAQGYEISRATSKDGPFAPIYSTNNWTTPFYTDTQVEPGRAYSYTVTALNNAGKSAPSEVVTAMPVAGGPLPGKMKQGSVSGAKFDPAAGGSFLVPGAGRDLGGNFVSMPVEGDFVLTARLVEWRGPVGMMGLMARETVPSSPATLAMTLGEAGGRQARFRAVKAGKTDLHPGDDYTWLPVWFRLQRQGDRITGYQSSDGIEWFAVGDSTLAGKGALQVGFLIGAGGKPPGMKKEDKAPLGLFDHVMLEKSLPAAPAAPDSLVVSNAGDGVARLVWKNAPDATRTGIKIETAIKDAPFYEIADLAPDATRFDNTGLQAPADLRYRVRAYNRGGYSEYSNTAQCEK
jgi:hypothetical protein